MIKETWKPISSSLYHFVSDKGRVKSIDCVYIFTNKFGTEIHRKRKGRILSPGRNRNGYLQVSLSRKKQHFYIHRIVAEAFLEVIDGKTYVNHINGMKHDNHPENLEWCTASENQLHSKKTGLAPTGEKHPQSKLSNSDIVFIRENSHLGLSSLAEKFKVTKSTIWKIIKGISRKHG